MCRRPRYANGLRGGECPHPETKLLQDVTQQEIVLVAVPSAFIPHQFLLERLHVQPNRPSEKRIQVLERNRLRMLKMNGCQRIDARRARAGIPDPFTVRVDIDS